MALVAVRKLKGRKRKKASNGRAVRLSDELLNYIHPRIKGLRSYDAYFRKVFGLDDWRGNPQPLVEGCLEVTTGQFFIKTGTWPEVEAVANGAAVIEAVKRKTKKVNKPLRLREISQ
jgi:hypothetical protein